ncbi:MAG: T9SS type A sorting domain-containing protein [Bacteroidota bacterium]
MKKFFFFALLFNMLFSQHKLPFASQNNTIELAITNSATIDAGNVTVTVSNAPTWIRFNNPRQAEGGHVASEIQNLKSGESGTSRFTFSVDKSAPVGKEHALQFVISSLSGEEWKKEISIQVAAPEQFELYQNYPNPFNPSTTISFLLPTAGDVSLKVFDVVGREVVTLFDEVKVAGFHQQVWDATNVATGVYIYQLSYYNQKGEQEYHRKKLLFLK